MKLLDYLVICSCLVFVVAVSYPITSQPLTNNPETWALEDSWLIFNPKNSVSLAEPLIASNSYDLKAKKITPKSIFIAPNSNFLTGPCLPGQRIDENGKCIKVVTVNKDDLILHQLHQLLQKGEDAGSNTNIDYDYDYSDDEDDDDDFGEDIFEESQGPQKFVLPLVLDNSDYNKNVAEDDKNKNDFIVDEVSNITKLLNDSKNNQMTINKNGANLLQTTTNRSILTTTASTPQTTTQIVEEEETTQMSTMPETLPTEFYFFDDYVDDETEKETTTLATDTTTLVPPTSTIKEDDILSTTTETNEVTTMTTVPDDTMTLFQKTEDTTEIPTTTEVTTTETDEDTTTIRTLIGLKPISARLKIHPHPKRNATIISESPNYQRNNSRRQKTSPANRPDQRLSNTAIIDRTHLPKKQSLTTLAYSQTTIPTRVPKRRASTTIEPTTIPTTTSSTTTQAPYVWVPRTGGDSSQRPQNKPVLIRFWSHMPLVQENAPVRPIDQPNLNYNFNTNSNNNRNLNHNYNYNNRPNFNTNPPNPYNSNNSNRPTFNTNTNPPNPYNNYNYQRRRSHLPQNTGSYRINSRQPSERLFREVSLQEVQSVLRL